MRRVLEERNGLYENGSERSDGRSTESPNLAAVISFHISLRTEANKRVMIRLVNDLE